MRSTSPLAVKTVVGLLDVVTVSNSAKFISFFLIMCIDAPESTTNYLSSDLRVNFPKVRRMLFFVSPLNLEYSWQASTLLRGHIDLATLSLLETDPQILEHWGSADEVHLGKSFQALDSGLDCQHDVIRLE